MVDMLCVEQHTTRGAALCGYLYTKTLSASPLISNACAKYVLHNAAVLFRMLHRCYSVLCDQLAMWVVYGRLNDPYDEFFITETPGSPSRGATRRMFAIRNDMLPIGIIDAHHAADILFIGQVLNSLSEQVMATPMARSQSSPTRSIGSPLTHAAAKQLDDYKGLFSPPAHDRMFSAADALKLGLLGTKAHGDVPRTAIEAVRLHGI